ncbi:MAG: cytochrome c oxidase subunit II [Rhodospirillaceae bacterium]|jgi:cytochrome c oxidase subunit II|nr:cytochrome c oxidase subunit II [Rhodospirillaceae bacterium]MBT3927302.1 cytochrome c oxidase subunit II [Rhodospirillaceae bacterium]MBT4425560.1 cytochrome c oxidase subunit II [Rhodospirillaceae bacterium]MBT5038992.1 cytochrome c oxidase subunit II [Rhodospirillaceae bacterium]MBT5674302.1 cytochrome c oxidase subunit II [Rhodospirillaceae bacterium]
MLKKKLTALAVFLTTIMIGGGVAMAQAPKEWQMGFQEAHSPTMERIISFNSILFWICVAMSIFVISLMVYIIFRFSAKRNPTPSKTSHNSLIEVLWTVIPVIILVAVAIPSFRLLYFMDRTSEAEMTIKAIGQQWFWTYEYPDLGEDISFDAFMIAEDELEEGQIRLLATDESVVVPIDTNIRLLVTATDVIHAWAIPSFGVKVDGIPGRVNETWFRVDAEGTYYGQCSELCGKDHAFMPIQVKAVSKEAYAEWVAYAKEEYASNDSDSDADQPVARLASAD